MKISYNKNNNNIKTLNIKDRNQEQKRISAPLNSAIAFQKKPIKLREVGRNINQRLYCLGLKVPLLKRYWVTAENTAKSFGITDYRETKAFRHVWTNADMTYKYNKTITKFLGNLNEYRNPFCVIKDANQDMWNNRVGRDLGAEAKKKGIPREQIGNLAKQALDEGKVVVNPDKDSRRYESKTFRLFERFANFLQKN